MMKESIKYIYMYLTDECNENCSHCWQSAPLAGKGVHSSLQFNKCEKFLNDLVEMGLKKTTISGGEPTINPELKKFAEYFYKKSIHVSMETNGILISDIEILNTIKNYNIYCAISLDGVNPETHNKHRGRIDAYQCTIRSIEKLEQEKIKYQLIMSISKFNYHELIPLLKLIKESFKYCDTFKINIVTGLGRAIQMKRKDLLFKAEELPGITEDVAALIDKYPFKIILHIDSVFFSFKNLMLKYSCGGYCGYKYALSILANGNISICSLGKQMDKYIFGHVSTIDVKDFWKNNPILANIHKSTYIELKGICSNCIFRRRCLGGCRAEALCAYGDFFAPNPICQDYYNSGKFPTSRLIDPTIESSYIRSDEYIR